MYLILMMLHVIFLYATDDIDLRTLPQTNYGPEQYFINPLSPSPSTSPSAIKEVLQKKTSKKKAPPKKKKTAKKKKKKLKTQNQTQQLPQPSQIQPQQMPMMPPVLMPQMQLMPQMMFPAIPIYPFQYPSYSMMLNPLQQQMPFNSSSYSVPLPSQNKKKITPDIREENSNTENDKDQDSANPEDGDKDQDSANPEDGDKDQDSANPEDADKDQDNANPEDGDKDQDNIDPLPDEGDPSQFKFKEEIPDHSEPQ